MTRNKLFVAASSIVVLVFLGSLILFLVRPIERSFAGTFPLLVGSAIVFTLPATPLLVWGRRLSKRNPKSQTFLVKALMVCFLSPFAWTSPAFALRATARQALRPDSCAPEAYPSSPRLRRTSQGTTLRAARRRATGRTPCPQTLRRAQDPPRRIHE